jgi:nucleoid DNA-binding protein
MNERINKNTLITQISQKTGQDAEIVKTIVDAFLDENILHSPTRR